MSLTPRSPNMEGKDMVALRCVKGICFLRSQPRRAYPDLLDPIFQSLDLHAALDASDITILTRIEFLRSSAKDIDIGL